MQPEESQSAVERCRRRLHNRWPIVGLWIRTAAARQLRDIRSPEAIRLLSETLIESDDESVRVIARDALCNLDEPDLMMAVCEVWDESRNEELAEYLREQRWRVTKPSRRHVLISLKSEQLEHLLDATPDQLPLLRSACADEDVTIARNAQYCLENLQRRHATDALCAEWERTRDPFLERIIRAGAHVADAPLRVHVHTALLCGNVDDLTHRGREIVSCLLEAESDPHDLIAQRASDVLHRLENREAIEEICRLVVEEAHVRAEEIALSTGYAPLGEHQRALFFFLTGQWRSYDALDFDRKMLRTVYGFADPDLRRRIALWAQRAGRLEWVVAVVGEKNDRKFDDMDEEDWIGVLDLLARRGRWDDLWQLAQESPPVWSIRILRQLHEADWHPDESTDRAGFDELAAIAAACPGNGPILGSRNEPLCSLRLHGGSVAGLAISADGRYFAAATPGGNVSVFHAATGKLADSFRGGAPLEWAPSQHVLMYMDEGMLRSYTLPYQTAQAFEPGLQGITAIHFAGDGDYVGCVGSSNDEAVEIRTWPGGSHVFTTKADSGEGTAFAFDENELRFAGSFLHNVRLWSLPHEAWQSSQGDDKNRRTHARAEDVESAIADRRIRHILKGHSSLVTSLCFSMDARFLCSGSTDGVIIVWEAGSGAKYATLDLHRAAITHLSATETASLLASKDANGVIGLWNLEDGRLLDRMDSQPGPLAISRDAQILASGGDDGEIELRTSVLFRGSRRALHRISGEERRRLNDIGKRDDLLPGERKWCMFAERLLNWRRRHDIELDDVRTRTAFGDFDIEIEV